ncbi:MAG: CRTAC1 family protein [Flavobacteriales bacterium]|nr:CRTAC1 family protein [Flavobacteriales bacterium]
MRYSSIVLVLALPAVCSAQTFTLNTTPLTNEAARSGGCVGIADMDGDGLDDLILLHQSKTLSIDYQNADGSFTSYPYGTVSASSQWGMAVGDVDNDGHKDFVSGGNGDGVHFVEISGRGVYTPVTNLNNGSMFMQGMNMMDINNDGSLDIFGCHDNAANRIWLNDGNGALTYNNYINFATSPSSDMSGNYGSTWTDFDDDGDIDLYITKCRQGVNSSSDPRRWNRLFVNDGNNQYTDQAATYGVQNREQSWASDFADIDNDGDLDLITANHSTTAQLFLNDGTGHYTDATAGSGLEYNNFYLQSKCEDLDNDGFIDLLCVEGNYYFHNDGDGTFTRITNLLPHPTANHTLHSFALGDMDHDGAIDIYASYGTSYVTPSTSRDDELYFNNGNANHFLNFNLEGDASNRDAVGARVTLYGAWGKQVREIRAGESYGIVCSFTCHFGLGTALQADSAVVRWPSGTVDRFYNLAADQWVDVEEGQTDRSKVALIAALGGPYDQGSGLMNDGLRNLGLVPVSEPYTALGYSIEGVKLVRNIPQSVLNVTGSNAIVDWVWLELRDAINPATVRGQRPALLQRDGDVVELDGVRPVAMGVPNGNYHVVVRHRNHFGAMTNAPLALGAAPTTVNFKLPGTLTYGTNARKDINGTLVLWDGNTRDDALLKYAGSNNDRDPILVRIGGTVPTASVSGYYQEDVNMNGQVKYAGSANDRDPILVNIGGSVPTASRTEQVP